MLSEARIAGENLLKAKEQVQHGEFGKWVKENCAFPERTAQLYMRVAKQWDAKAQSIADLNGVTIADFMGWTTPRAQAPIPTATTLDRDDAAHALKLHAMAERGEDQKSKVRRADVGGLRPGKDLIAVSESGLYDLALRSDKPEARDFQDWVTRVVLPAIRKDGAYVMGEEKVATGEVSALERRAGLRLHLSLTGNARWPREGRNMHVLSMR